MTDIFLKPTHSLYDAVRIIESTFKRIVVVVDSEGRLLGTMTDGDIRRCLLSGGTLESEVSIAMNTNPIVARPDTPKDYFITELQKNNLQSLPIIDENSVVLRVFHISELLSKDDFRYNELKFVSAVIMAGGEGTRLRPLTEGIPKPMVEIGGLPLLERQVTKLVKFGVKQIYISINYLGKIIEDYFGDGSHFDASIKYLRENMKMGTAGALSLLPEEVNGPILIMNGDIFSTYDLNNFCHFHQENRADITVGAVEYRVEIPFGVIKANGAQVIGLEEKPSQSYLCNAGIYALSKEILGKIPQDSFFNMTDLISLCLNENKNVAVFPVHEYWTDIGTPEDLERARKYFNKLGRDYE